MQADPSDVTEVRRQEEGIIKGWIANHFSQFSMTH